MKQDENNGEHKKRTPRSVPKSSRERLSALSEVAEDITVVASSDADENAPTEQVDTNDGYVE